MKKYAFLMLIMMMSFGAVRASLTIDQIQQAVDQLLAVDHVNQEVQNLEQEVDQLQAEVEKRIVKGHSKKVPASLNALHQVVLGAQTELEAARAVQREVEDMQSQMHELALQLKQVVPALHQTLATQVEDVAEIKKKVEAALASLAADSQAQVAS